MLRYDICFHPDWWHKRAGIDFSRVFWENAAYRMEADVLMRKTMFECFGAFGLGEKDPAPRPLVGSDYTACGFLLSEMLGCRVVYAPDDAPQVLCAELDDEQALQLKVPDFDASEPWIRQEEQMRALMKEYGRVECHLNLMGVQNIALDHRGQELFQDYYDEDSPAENLLNVSYQTMAEACRRLKRYSPYISGGVTNVISRVCPEVTLTSNCTVEMTSLSIYEHFLLKYDCLLAREFAPFGIHHCGQTMEHVVEGYAKVPNVTFAEVGAFSDLEKVKNALPDTVRLNARFSPVRLGEASPEEIRAEVADMARIVPGPRLSISCAGIDSSVPDEKICAFLEACRNALAD